LPLLLVEKLPSKDDKKLYKHFYVFLCEKKSNVTDDFAVCRSVSSFPAKGMPFGWDIEH